MSYGVLSHRQYGFFMSIQMMWVVPADDAGFFCIMPAVLRPVCLSSMPVLLCFPPGWGVFGPRFQGVKRLASPVGETNGRGCAYIRQDKTRRNRQDIGNACRWLGCLSCLSACGRIIRHIRPDAPVSSGCRCCRACVSWLQCRARWQRGGRSLPSGRHSPN